MADILLRDILLQIMTMLRFHSDYDFWVVKLDGTGNLVWERTLGDPVMIIASFCSANYGWRVYRGGRNIVQ